MDNESIMAGAANCKRYLQNKLGERKRRRPNNTALIESSEIVEERCVGDTTRFRQTTRQVMQKNPHLITTTINNNLTKTPNKSCAAGVAKTKKHLRSNKQEPSPPSCQGDDIQKSCSSSLEYENEMLCNFRVDFNSRNTFFLPNGSSQEESNNENYKMLPENDIKEKDEEKDKAKTLQFKPEDHKRMKEMKNELSNSYVDLRELNKPSSYHKTYKESIFEDWQSLKIKEIKPTNLKENKQAKSKELAQNLQIDDNNHYDDDDEDNDHDNDDNQDDDDEYNDYDEDHDHGENKHECEKIKSPQKQNHTDNQKCNKLRSTSHFNQMENEQQRQQEPVKYENVLSNLSCSNMTPKTNSTNCQLTMGTMEPKNFPIHNESKQPIKDEIIANIKETNPKNILIETPKTMSSSIKYQQKNFVNIKDSLITGEETGQYCRHYNNENDENNACTIKSITPPATLAPINVTKQPETYSENAIEADCAHQNLASKPAANKAENSNDIDDLNKKEMKEEEARGEEEVKAIGTFENPETSLNINIEQYDNKVNNLTQDLPTNTTIDHIPHHPLKQLVEEDEKQKQQKPNQQRHEQHKQNEQIFDKYLKEHSHEQLSNAFETTPTATNERITHQQQQHEKDIIDAADKVYTQIEEQQYQQQHQVEAINSTTQYEQILNNHNHQQHQHDPTIIGSPLGSDPTYVRPKIVSSSESFFPRENLAGAEDLLQQQQIQTLQHVIQQQQQHYTADQLYQMQQQEHQLHMQQQHQMPKQDELQQHHSLTRNPQREHRQQHSSHLMDFLHPQHHHHHSPLHQQQQMHEVYHDLMMDEFHEEQHNNTPYKLGLSPSTVKHENQDDGYETSAGDVLTPNSHASSTHSVTPQHHMQHGGSLVTNVVKCEEQHQQQHSLQLQQQSQHSSQIINDRNQNIQQELVTNETSGVRDPYHFIDDGVNAANNSLRNILTPPHSNTRNNQEAGSINGFMVMQSETPVSGALNSNSNDIYNLTNSTIHHLHHGHHHLQKPNCLDTNANHHQQQHFAETTAEIMAQEEDAILKLQNKSIQKRRGRKKKLPEGGLPLTLERTNPNDGNSLAGFTKTKERKKHDRFNGMSEEEVVKRILPDHLCDNLDIVIIGINPGLFAAYKGHHYAGPGNHFWKCLYLSGLTQEQMNADEDFKLIKYGIGFTNMVQRATKGSADLTRKEIKEGSRILLEKLQRFRPKIAVFNGKLIFEVFSGKKDFNFGRQPECVEGTDTFIWVMPSSSARCAQLPRAADKVPFYAALKKFRDYLNGLIPHLDQSECVFTEERIKRQCEQENFRNQENGAIAARDNGGVTTSYPQNTGGYAFDGETNVQGGGEGPGPPQNTVSNNFMMSSLVGVSQHEKKKRGRPKKIKGQEMIIDPVTGNKIPLMGAGSSDGGDYADILNLSLVPGSSNNNEMPKKKRGRPKKNKTPANIMPQDMPASSTGMLSQKANIMSIQNLTTSSTHQNMQPMQTNHHQHVDLYATPPPPASLPHPSQHQRSIYSPLASPMASPALNCSYTTKTPPSQTHHDKLETVKASTGDLGQQLPVNHHQQHPIPDQTFGESPPPSSPNICTVDFEPPNAASTATSSSASIISDNVNTDLNALHQRLQSSSHQRSRYNSPISGEATTPEHFQQWLSPQPNIHSPAAAAVSSAAPTMFVNSPQQPSLGYHEQQQQQMPAVPQSQHPQHPELHTQWPLRHHNRYEDLNNSPYLLSSQLQQQTHTLNHTLTHTHTNPQTNHNQNSDVARKSLSGLESLVDQIPTITESESLALSSAAVVNAQVAAAAAVESRLQGMQQNSSIGESQVIADETHFSSITGTQNVLTARNNSSSTTTATTNNSNNQQQSNNATNFLNSNFSVTNLAASAVAASSGNQENYSITTDTRTLANANAYHHTNLMAAAVLAAAAANSPTTNLSTSTTANAVAGGSTNHHASMYMESHNHLTSHVPVNSLYPTVAAQPHHSAIAAAHHHAAAVGHYGNAQHSTADYGSPNNPYASAAVAAAATSSHTLHMPSPNYPYCYTTATSQTNYTNYPHSHSNHAHPHHPHHGHHPHHHHGHPHHHLTMFERLKSSDITGYSTGF